MNAKLGAVIVLTTVGDQDVARAFALSAVESRLAACVQCVPVQSVYRWKGAVEEAGETLLIMKTASERAEDLLAWIRARHPYELPEIVAVPIAAGLPAYLEWILSETAP